MTLVQKQTFRYFWDFAHPESGLAHERSNGGAETATIGGSGFGVMAIIVGIERGFVTREQGAERMLKIVRFLSDKNTDSYHGMWAHWMNGKTGKTIPFSRKDDGADIVESAFMFEGLLAAHHQYVEPSGTAFQAQAEALARDEASVREIAPRMVRPQSAVGESAESKALDKTQLDTQLARFARRSRSAEALGSSPPGGLELRRTESR